MQHVAQARRHRLVENFVADAAQRLVLPAQHLDVGGDVGMGQKVGRDDGVVAVVQAAVDVVLDLVIGEHFVISHGASPSLGSKGRAA